MGGGIHGKSERDAEEREGIAVFGAVVQEADLEAVEVVGKVENADLDAAEFGSEVEEAELDAADIAVAAQIVDDPQLNAAKLLGKGENAELDAADGAAVGEGDESRLNAADVPRKGDGGQLDAVYGCRHVKQPGGNSVEGLVREGDPDQAHARKSFGDGTNAEVNARDGIVAGSKKVEAEANDGGFVGDELELESLGRGPACSDLQRRKAAEAGAGAAQSAAVKREKRKEKNGREAGGFMVGVLSDQNEARMSGRG